MMWDVRTVQQKATHSTAIVGSLSFSGLGGCDVCGGGGAHVTRPKTCTHTHMHVHAHTEADSSELYGTEISKRALDSRLGVPSADR